MSRKQPTRKILLAGVLGLATMGCDNAGNDVQGAGAIGGAQASGGAGNGGTGGSIASGGSGQSGSGGASSGGTAGLGSGGANAGGSAGSGGSSGIGGIAGSGGTVGGSGGSGDAGGMGATAGNGGSMGGAAAGTAGGGGIASNGFSCGGLMAQGTVTDPRFVTWGVTSSGMAGATQPFYDLIDTPVLFVEGGPSEVAYDGGVEGYEAITQLGVPVLWFSKDLGHGGDLFQPGGGDFTKINLAWLNWWLKGDETATGKGLLVGTSCPYCSDSAWEVRSANVP